MKVHIDIIAGLHFEYVGIAPVVVRDAINMYCTDWTTYLKSATEDSLLSQ